MSKSDELKGHLLEEVARTHERFVELMNDRLGEIDPGDVERYFGLMSTLVAKLEAREKTLRDIAREMMAESAGWIMSELARS